MTAARHVADAERIAFVGSIGAGKTTLARRVGVILGREVVHLDELWWEPGGYQRTPERVKTRTMEAEQWRQLNQQLADGETWIIDGSLHLLAIRLARADTIIFVDLPRRVCLLRVARRWCASRPDQRDDLRGALAWLWVLLRWVWRYPQKRRWILHLIAEHAADAHVVHVRTRGDVRSLLRQMEERPPAPRPPEHHAADRP